MGGVLAEFFLPGFRGLDFPDGFHLFAAIGFLHELVVEGVAGLFVFGGPDDGFGGVGEIAAREIGRRVGLNPGDVVELTEIRGEERKDKDRSFTQRATETQRRGKGLRQRTQRGGKVRRNMIM